MILVGNKTDLQTRSQLTPDTISKWSKENGFSVYLLYYIYIYQDHIEVSAKNNENMEDLFDTLTRTIIDYRLELQKMQYKAPFSETQKVESIESSSCFC